MFSTSSCLYPKNHPEVNIYLLSLNYYSVCNIIRLSVIACSQLNARVCVFVVNYYKICVFVVYYFCVF